jgi:hypothetical protein
VGPLLGHAASGGRAPKALPVFFLLVSCGTGASTEVADSTTKVGVASSVVTTRPSNTVSAPTSSTIPDRCNGDPRQYGPPGPHITEVDVGFTYRIEEGVLEADRELTRKGIAAGVRYLSDHFGGIETGICVDVRLDPSRTSQGEYLWGSNLIIMFTNETGFGSTPIATHPLWHMSKTAAHELAHHWQSEFERGLGEHIPGWMREGFAEYASFNAVVEAGLVAEAEAFEFALMEASQPNGKPLHAHEILDADNPMNYGLAMLAIERLAVERGATALRTFWTSLRTMGWEEAFGAAFSSTPEAFYEVFEEFRAQGFPR